MIGSITWSRPGHKWSPLYLVWTSLSSNGCAILQIQGSMVHYQKPLLCLQGSGKLWWTILWIQVWDLRLLLVSTTIWSILLSLSHLAMCLWIWLLLHDPSCTLFFSARLPRRISYLAISIDLGRQVLEVFWCGLPRSFCSVLLAFLSLSSRFLSASSFTGACLVGGCGIFYWYDRICMSNEEERLYCVVISLYEGGSHPFREEAMGDKRFIYCDSRTGAHGLARVFLPTNCQPLTSSQQALEGPTQLL